MMSGRQAEKPEGVGCTDTLEEAIARMCARARYMLVAGPFTGSSLKEQLVSLTRFEATALVGPDALELIDHLAAGMKFDAIVLDRLTEDLAHPQRLLWGIRDYLAPDGRLIVSFANVAYARNRLKLLRGEFDVADICEGRSPLKLYTRGSMRELLEYSGYIVESMDWLEEPVNEWEFCKVLDEMNILSLERVAAAFASADAAATYYVASAVPASEDARIRSLIEEVRAARAKNEELSNEVCASRDFKDYLEPEFVKREEEIARKNEYIEHLEEVLRKREVQ